ncbi:MAG: hypothetical protein KME42_14185 [Tildeniella nuda ZEHNDER 1965/U140]|jgi:hypothetical protein|nr:hypothetical protein [Tildeniella nuda ZEHNDER 1965/U140]
MLQFPSFDSAIASVPGMGQPEPWQLDQMNKFRPKGMKPYTADQMVSVPMLASHNLMSFSNGVWDDQSIESMAAFFPGKPMNLNHSWEDVQQNVGFVYSAYAIQTPDAPVNILNAADYFDINRSIVANHGFQFLLTYAAFPADSPAVNAIGYGMAKDVSTGGITDSTMICPLCDGEFFTDECDGHMPPHPMLLFFLGDEEGIDWAPYYIRAGFHTAVELTLCVSGNLPGAEVLTEPEEAGDPVEEEAGQAIGLQVIR